MDGFIEGLTFVFLTLSLLFLFTKFERDQVSFLPIIHLISDLRLKLISRTAPSDLWNTHSKEWHPLVSLVQEAYFHGLPLEDPSDMLMQQIVKEEEYRLEKKRCLLILIPKIVTMMGFGLAARFCTLYFFMKERHFVEDRIHLLIALFLAFIFFFAVLTFYPKSWFFYKSLQPEGLSWIQALFLNKLTSNDFLYKEWTELEDRERTIGISLTHPRKLLLGIWCTKNNIEFQKKLRMFEDCLPLFEYAVLGLCLSLILFNPVVTLLKIST